MDRSYLDRARGAEIKLMRANLKLFTLRSTEVKDERYQALLSLLDLYVAAGERHHRAGTTATMNMGQVEAFELSEKEAKQISYTIVRVFRSSLAASGLWRSFLESLSPQPIFARIVKLFTQPKIDTDDYPLV